jgi:hypothetical protein
MNTNKLVSYGFYIIVIPVLVLTLSLAPVSVQAQANPSAAFYQGKTTVVLRILNAYNSTAWQSVDNYTTNGYTIKAVIPASVLEPDINNPSSVLVIAEKQVR